MQIGHIKDALCQNSAKPERGIETHGFYGGYKQFGSVRTALSPNAGLKQDAHAGRISRDKQSEQR